jgi:hypothetical protein
MVSELAITVEDGRYVVRCGHEGCAWRCPLTCSGRNRQTWNGRNVGAALHHLASQHGPDGQQAAPEVSR